MREPRSIKALHSVGHCLPPFSRSGPFLVPILGNTIVSLWISAPEAPIETQGQTACQKFEENTVAVGAYFLYEFDKG